MREYLFRGKGNPIYNNGDWYYGYLGKDHEGDYYIGSECSSRTVIADTVGQYTGLKDKNGKRIFEDDILRDDWGKIYEVIFTTDQCGFVAECKVAPNQYEKGRYRLGDAWCNTIAVIGNSHDNPELFGVQNE